MKLDKMISMTFLIFFIIINPPSTIIVYLHPILEKTYQSMIKGLSRKYQEEHKKRTKNGSCN